MRTPPEDMAKIMVDIVVGAGRFKRIYFLIRISFYSREAFCQKAQALYLTSYTGFQIGYKMLSRSA